MIQQHLLLRLTYNGIQSNKEILSTFHGALDAADAHIRRSVEYEFFPEGLTSMVTLGESHATISTWPEEGLAQVDYFSCADEPNFKIFEDYFQERGFDTCRSQIINRMQ